MIGKARLVSASPYRATYRMDKSPEMLDQDSDNDFQREELPELNRSHMSPIKDDSMILRN
jgi:hypothetical protein